MASEKLIAFILKAKQNKRTDDQVIQQLLSVGWKQAAIDEAMAEIKSQKAPAQPSAPAQPQATAPPWVKPAQQPQAGAGSAAQAAPQQPSATASPQQPQQPPSTSIPQQMQQPAPASTAPPWAAQTAPQQATASQPPAMQTPQPSPRQPIPPSMPIELPQKKPSFLSSLFGKKQPAIAQAQPQEAPANASQPAQPQAAQNAPRQQPAPAGAPQRAPIFPPHTPQQTALQPPSSQQGQSTLGEFQPLPAQGAQPGQAQQQPAQGGLQMPPLPGTKPTAPQFQPAQQPSPAQPGGIMRLMPVLAAIALIAIAAGAYYFLIIAPSQSPITPSVPIAPSNQTQLAAPIECGNDLGCMAQAAGSCQRAKATQSATMDLSGAVVSSSAYLEITGASPDGKCPLFIRSDSASVKFSNTAVAAALAQGATMDEIRQQEEAATREAQASVGKNGTCKFQGEALPSMLARWKAGTYSLSDYSVAECEGPMFAGGQPSAASYSLNLTSVSKANATQGAGTAPAANSTPAPKANSSSGQQSNATRQNSTSAANATKPSPQPPANSTAAPKANASSGAANASAAGSANQSGTALSFRYTRKYTSYFPEKLSWFCPDRHMEFYRVHWQEYFGSNCNAGKPKEGFVNYTDYLATGCTVLPCCINGPYNEYSRSYDYFECGYNEGYNAS